jgi:hypothetical protein
VLRLSSLSARLLVALSSRAEASTVTQLDGQLCCGDGTRQIRDQIGDGVGDVIEF